MNIVKVNENNFEKEVLNSNKTVLLDFFAVWCGPCKMIAPVLEEIANENDDVKICKIDVDEAMSLAQSFGVSSIPTLVVIKNGSVTDQAVGLRGKEEILKMIK